MSWSPNENKRFELATAEYCGRGLDITDPRLWQLVAQALGGGRTADDAWQHYLELYGDIDGMAADERTARCRELYHQQHQHGADANNNSRRRSNNGGEGSSSNNNSRGDK